MLFLKRQLPLVLTFLLGMTVLICYYVPNRAASTTMEHVLLWMELMMAAVGVFGSATLAVMHGGTVLSRKAGWGYSLIVIVGIFAGVGLALATDGREYADDGSLTPFGWYFTYIYNPLSAAMFAMLAFFIASAAFRAFRARTVAAALLLGTAMLIMFAQAPLGEQLWAKLVVRIPDLPALGVLKGWINDVLVVAGKRGIMIGVSLGVIATALRVILGIERGHLGGDT